MIHIFLNILIGYLVFIIAFALVAGIVGWIDDNSQ
jgi:hypothetical protein